MAGVIAAGIVVMPASGAMAADVKFSRRKIYPLKSIY
jgi:hypothetical protein